MYHIQPSNDLLLKPLQTQKATTDKPVETPARDSNRRFTKKEILVTSEYRLRCSASLVIRQVHVKPRHATCSHPPERLNEKGGQFSEVTRTELWALVGIAGICKSCYAPHSTGRPHSATSRHVPDRYMCADMLGTWTRHTFTAALPMMA